MVFVFHIFLLIFHISTTNNYVLKKKHIQGEVTNLSNNENLMNVQDADNITRVLSTLKPLFQIIHDLKNTKSSNLKSNVFDKRLSDEMFSIKQHGYEMDMAYTAPNLVNPKSRLATPTLELKQKWPIIDLLFQSDNIPGSLQYIDEFEKMYLINSTLEQNEDSTTENAVAVKKCVNTDDQKDEKDKVVGLRSLSANVPSHLPGRMYHSIAIKQCTCAKTIPTTTPSAVRMDNTPHKCTAGPKGSTGDCTRKIVSNSILPYYIPYDMPSVTTDFPSFYYPPYVFDEFKIPKPSKHQKHPRPFIEDDLYYEDSFDRERYDNDNDYLENERQVQKKKKRKQAKDNVIIIDYDVEPNDKKISWKTKVHNENPDVLANDILDDLKTNYSDTIIKTCFCATSSRGMTTSSFLLTSSLCLFLYLNLYLNE